ncbi:MAG: hypothetical protein CSA33_09425, partial [Desulfobulbus propionicus]
MERVVFSEEQYFGEIDAMSNKMTRLKKRVLGVVLIAGVFLGMHFLWMYCLPVPKDNLSKSQLFSIRPEMSAEQVISILGRPEFMKVFNQSEHGSKATVFSNDFVRITNSSKKCTWVFSNQDYFQKKLEFYINFVDGSVARVAV